MSVAQTASFSIHTKGRNDCVNVTGQVQDAVKRGKLTEGVATVFVSGSTAGVTTIEFEPGVVQDLSDALRRLFPENLHYAHHKSVGDDNGFSHLRASLLGPSLTIPVAKGRLQLGTWRQIVIVDCDTHPRQRTVLVQLLGV